MAKICVLLFVVFYLMCCVKGDLPPPQYWDNGCGGDPYAKRTPNYMSHCEPTCEIPNHHSCFYLSHQAGCTCKKGFYRNKAWKCVPMSRCNSDSVYPNPRPYNPYPGLNDPLSIYQQYHQPQRPTPINVPFNQPSHPSVPIDVPYSPYIVGSARH